MAELPRAMGVVRNPLVLSIMDGLEFVAYRSANSCIALSPGIAQGIIRRGVAESAWLLLRMAAIWICLPPMHHSRYLKLPVCRQTRLWRRLPALTGLANGLDAVLNAAGEVCKRGRTDITCLHR